MIKAWHLFVIVFLMAIAAAIATAATTNDLGHVVLIANDGVTTIPPNSIATPGQVAVANDTASSAYAVALESLGLSGQCRSEFDALLSRLQLYSTNYLIKSVARCEGVGGVNFDPSNQTMRIYYMSNSVDYLTLRGVAKITPLGATIPRLEFRASLMNTHTWTNLSIYTSSAIAVPTNFVGQYEKAYEYVITKPAGSQLFMRMVDGSSGISGSGWYWLVYGDIVINRGGRYYRGRTGVETNIVGSVTNVVRYASGLNVEIEPLGGL